MKKPSNKHKEVTYKRVTLTEDEADNIIRNEKLELIPGITGKSGYYGVFQERSSDDFWRLRFKLYGDSKIITLKIRFNSPVAAAIHFARLVKKHPYYHPLQKMIVKHNKVMKRRSISNM